MTAFHTSPARSARVRRLYCTVLLLTLPSLASCAGSLTRGLWAKSDERLPRVTIHTLTSCPIQSVRGSLPTDVAPGELVIDFSASSRDVGHLRKYSPANPGQLILRAGPRNESALQHQMFRPETIDIDVFNASYRHGNQFSAVLVYRGTSLSMDLGEFVPESEINPLFRAARLSPDRTLIPSLKDCIENFAGQDWKRLLSTDPLALVAEGPNLIENVLGRRNEAVVWLDPDGRYLSTEKLTLALLASDREFSLEQCSMLGRLAGPPRQFVRVPVSVLLEIDDLDMQRDNNLIHWRKCELWSAQFATQRMDSTHLAALSIPVAREAFTYLWAQDHEVEKSFPGLATVGKVILTPVTLVIDTLDFFVKTTPMLKNIRDALIGEAKKMEINVDGPEAGPIDERSGTYKLPKK